MASFQKEEKIAQRLSKKLGLEPPVDVYEIAKSRSIFYEINIPFNIDGICLDLKSINKKPTIMLNSRMNPLRKRFTLAHEIGHIMIPWHTGDICDDIDSQDGRDEYFRMEREANLFAAELLMPRQWSTGICSRAEHLRGAMHTIQMVGGVSSLAAAIRTAEVGPAGYLVALIKDGRVGWSRRTEGTRARPPRRGTEFAAIDMPAFAPPEVLSYGETSYYWWKERDELAVGAIPQEPWRIILERILLDFPAEDRHKVRQSVNAIIGFAVNRFPAGSPIEQMMASCKHALQNRNDRDKNLEAVLRHPEIDDYITARLYERAAG